MNKILIVSANPWSFALAVERQFGREHASSRTDLLNLYRLLGSSQPGIRRRDWLIEFMDRKIDRFVRPVINGRDITAEVRLDRTKIPPLPDRVADVRACRVGSAAVGLGALSSAAEITTIYCTESSAVFGEALERAWRTSHLSLQVGTQVAQLGYDKVLIFGGRHAPTRAFADTLRSSSEVVFYEQGGAGDRAVFSTESIYEPDHFARLVEKYTDFSRPAGEAFFEARINRAPGTPSAFFTADQEPGTIPKGLRSCEFVTFFTSSPDELFGITEEVRFGQFRSQAEAAAAIAESCAASGKRLVIRFHPHLNFKHESWRNEWDFDRLRAADVTVIMPDDPWDSYSLARASHCVFTCGSTIGLESTYLEVPNAVIGRGLPSALGASVEVNDEREIAEFIERPQLLANGRDRAMLLGSYFQCRAGVKVAGLAMGTHPNFARIDGKIVDPVRYAFQSLRSGIAVLSGQGQVNRSGLVDGLVLLPSGAQYSKHLKRMSRVTD